MAARRRLAITVGDPRGIGPEVVSRALESGVDAETTVIGPDDVIRTIRADALVGVGEWGESLSRGPAPQELALAGRLAGRAVEEAVRLWREGRADAIVTGPGDKQALNAAGYRYPGHTELLRDLTGAPQVVMMLASERLRVVFITTHLSLRDALASLTVERIVEIGALARSELARLFGLAAPRLALCAVNPHAGDGGLFGTEDDAILRPAALALDIAGPLPADTVFVRAMRGEFDAVLAPYHDVGMTAVKVASFGRAVNVTLGLPVPRTAPDHGTALDIAGKGVADASSMRAAIELAVEIVRRRQGAGASTRASPRPPTPPERSPTPRAGPPSP